MPEPRFVEALLDGLGAGAESVAGVLVQERAPELIDSAGVVADRTLMGFDYLHGEPLAAATARGRPARADRRRGALPPRRPSTRSAASTSGSSSTTRTSTWRCGWRPRAGAAGLAPEARAVHAYSASLGAGSAAKYAHTGWSRGYMLRRYGVMRSPRLALRALACEATICAGQLLDRPHGRRACAGACAAGATAAGWSGATPGRWSCSTSRRAGRSACAGGAGPERGVYHA